MCVEFAHPATSNMQVQAVLATLIISLFSLKASAVEGQTNQFESLANATVFKLGLVGIAAQISEEELALGALLDRRDAQVQLLALLENAKSDEGKLYALCGLRQLSKQLFEKELHSVKWESHSVNVMHADVIASVPVKNEVRRLRRDGCAVQKQ